MAKAVKMSVERRCNLSGSWCGWCVFEVATGRAIRWFKDDAQDERWARCWAKMGDPNAGAAVRCWMREGA